MSSFRIDPEQDRIEQLRRSEEIRKLRLNDPSKQKDSKQTPSEEPRPGFAAFVFLVAQQLLDFLKELINKKLYSAEHEDIAYALRSLKITFEIMSEEDKSQDSAFLKSIARLWHILLKEHLKDKTDSLLNANVEALIKHVQSEPKHHEHSLGHYLETSENMHWIPFPYMELIHDLYRQHKADPQSSLLTAWIHLIDKIDLLRN